LSNNKAYEKVVENILEHAIHIMKYDITSIDSNGIPGLITNFT